MTKKKRKQIDLINTLSLGPVVLLPFIYFSLVKIQKFQDWYIIPLISLPIGWIIGKLILSAIESSNKGISKLKNRKGFKLSHFVITTSVLLTFVIFTFINVTFPVESTVVEYQISSTGQRGSGRNKTSYVEIINEKGKPEKINFSNSYIKSLADKKSIQLKRHKSLFGLIYLDRK